MMSDLNARDRRAAEKWVMRMLDDPDQHRATLECWLAEKPARRELYESLKSDVEGAGRAAAGLRGQSRTPNRPFAWRPALAAACVILLALAAGTTIFRYHQPEPLLASNTRMIATHIGEVRQLTQEDGSQLILDTGTRISTFFTADERRITLLSGRARFIVAHDASRPFIVEASGHEVVATGTIFDVTNRGTILVHLLQGSVEIRETHVQETHLPPQSIRLHPGEQVAFAGGQEALPSAMSARSSDEQWVDGVKSLDDVPINDVIAEANLYSETKIIMADPSLGERKIFGDIHIRDIHAVAQTIATYLQLEIDRTEPSRIILRASK